MLPDYMRAQLLVARRKRYWRNARLVFIHVPKSAGTSISYEIYGRFIGHIAAKHVIDFAPFDVASLPRFAVVRHPLSRILSSYLFATRGPTSDGGPTAGMFRAEKYTLHSFRNVDAFVQEWLVAQDLSRIDYVFRKQTFYTHDQSARCLTNFVGRTEDMPKVERFVSDVVGRDVRFGHYNKTDKVKVATTGLGRESRKIIERIYSDDFELLGY